MREQMKVRGTKADGAKVEHGEPIDIFMLSTLGVEGVSLFSCISKSIINRNNAKYIR
jgi:hypothetical protein